MRLSADHAAYLALALPRAKLVFLIRNPYDAFRSYAARRDKGWRWSHRWPDHPLTPERRRHWRELAGSFWRPAKPSAVSSFTMRSLNAGGWEQLQRLRRL